MGCQITKQRKTNQYSMAIKVCRYVYIGFHEHFDLLSLSIFA